MKTSYFLFPVMIALITAGCSTHPTGLNPSMTITSRPPTETSTPVSPTTKTPQAEPATPTYPPTPTQIPDSWRTYTNSALHLKFRYPANWLPETSSRFSGPDGYFEWSTQTYPASEFDSLTTLCVLEANENKPASFGMYPFVSMWQGLSSTADSVVSYGCTVTPGNDQPGSPRDRAVLFARYPAPWPRDKLVVLTTNSAAFNSILSTFQFTDFVTPTPHPINIYNSPACDVLPDDPSASISHLAGLTITEYPIANSKCDPWVHFDGFQARVRSLNLNNATRYDEDRFRQAQAANRLIEPFGYRLVNRQFGLSNPPGSTAPSEIKVFDLYQGDRIITAGITQFGQVSVSAGGDDFILWVQDTFNNKPAIEVRPGSLRTLNWWESGFNSAWVGTNQIRYEYSSDHLFPVGAASQTIVYQNDEAIYNLIIPQPGPAGNPVQPLWAWHGHWILEVENVVVQDGVLQNPLLGFDEMFAWHLVNEKPFFFFSTNGVYGISYDGQNLPQRYEDIIHGPLCCDPAAYSLESSSAGARFYALKNKTWYLVSVMAE